MKSSLFRFLPGFAALLLGAVPLRAADAPSPLQAGRDLMKVRKFTEAVTQFDQAVAQQPAPASAFYERGNARAELGQTPEALADLTEAIRLKPELYEAWYLRGHVHARRNEHHDAIADFTEASRLRPESALAFHYRGISHFELSLQLRAAKKTDEADDEKEKAATDFAEAIRLDPKLAEAYYYHARAEVDWDTNVGEYTTAIKLAPGHSLWHYWRGNAYMFTDRPDEAIADFTEAIRLDPKDQHPYNDRASLYSKQGRRELAVADLTEAIKLRPDLPFFRRNRALNYLHLDKWELARQDLTDALRLMPEYWECYTRRAWAEIRLGDKEAATADLAKGEAHSTDEEDPFLNYVRGEVYAGLGEYDKSVGAYTAYLSTRKNDLAALINRGAAHGHLREFDEGIDDETTALYLDPKNRYAHQALGTIYFAQGEVEKAREEYTQALAVAPREVDLSFNRALADFRLRRTADFNADAARYVELAGWQGQLPIYLALMRATGLRRDGDKAGAQAALTEAAAKCDPSLWPFPVLQTLCGERTSEDLLKSVGDDKLQNPEARAYTGLYLAADGNTAKAVPLLQWVSGHADPTTNEFAEATQELKRLGQPPPPR